MENNDEGLLAFKWKEEENSDGREHLLFSTQLPPEDNLRCKIHIGDLPDPNNITYVLNRVYLKYCDPGLCKRVLLGNS